MLQINEEKGSKGEKSLYSNEAQPKIDYTQEKDRNTYETSKLPFFLIAMFLITMTVKISFKSKGPIYKDIIFSFDYYNGTKNAKKLDINFERNYSGTNGYIYQDIFFNPLNFLISSQAKWKNNIFDKFANMDKTEDNNNLKIYKETKLVSSLGIIFNEMILDKDVLCISFDMSNYNKRREEKRENCNPGGAPEIKMDLNKNGFFVIEKLFEKTLNLKGRIKNNNENKRIEYNTKNKRKNKIITNISLINNNIITIKFLILIKINSHKLSYNKNIMINFQFSHIILINKAIRTKNVFSSNINIFKRIYYPNGTYIKENEYNIFISNYDRILYNEDGLNKYIDYLSFLINIILLIMKIINYREEKRREERKS